MGSLQDAKDLGVVFSAGPARAPRGKHSHPVVVILSRAALRARLTTTATRTPVRPRSARSVLTRSLAHTAQGLYGSNAAAIPSLPGARDHLDSRLP
jgi:hypothetical protein